MKTVITVPFLRYLTEDFLLLKTKKLHLTCSGKLQLHRHEIIFFTQKFTSKHDTHNAVKIFECQRKQAQSILNALWPSNNIVIQYC